MHATPWRRVLAAGLGAGLSTIATLMPTSASHAATRAGTSGYCPSALGVTVVVDYQDLGAYGTSTGKTTIRCAPPQHAGTPFSGTALQALTAAGFTVAGTARWGTAFVCRVQGRPAPTETVPIPGNPTYQEKCLDTPPASAFWSSWHATNGGTWTYSTQGASTRKVTGGTFEGWSFAHDKTSSTIPKPRVTPKRPAAPTTAPSAPTAAPRTSSTSVAPVPAASTTTLRAPSRPRAQSRPARTAQPQAAAPQAAVAAPRVAATSTGKASTSKASTGKGSTGKASTTVAAAVTFGSPAAARDWLTAQLRSDGSMPASFGTGSDEGLGVDALWALQATGASESAVRHVWSALSTPAAVDDFTGPGFYRQAGMPDARFGGRSAKLLLAAATVGADVTNVGGRDLRRQTLELVEASGPEAGRVRDAGTGVDNTNLIGQALAVMGLGATGPLPADTVTYLLSQQCSAGFFRLYDNDGRSCDAAAAGEAPADNDATAFGVQALLAAAAADGGSARAPAAVTEGIRRGLAYLASAQHADGSFGGGVGTADANSNSTGLAAATLAAGGNTAAAARAGAWVASLQATTAKAAGTPLAGDVGAIAYDPAALAQGLTGGGIDADQWRRATAQAVLALSPHAYFSLAGSGPGAGGTPPPTTPPTTTPPRTTQPPTTPPTTEPVMSTPPTGASVPTSTGADPSPTRPAARSVMLRNTTAPTIAAPPSHAWQQPAPAPVAATLATGQVSRTRTPSRPHTPVAVAATAPTPTSATTSGAAGLEAGPPLSGVPAHATSQRSGSTAPVLWAVLGGLLLGGLVTFRPWPRSGWSRPGWRRPRGRHS